MVIEVVLFCIVVWLLFIFVCDVGVNYWIVWYVVVVVGLLGVVLVIVILLLLVN